MAPQKKAAGAAKENVTLGPLAGDGMCCSVIWVLVTLLTFFIGKLVFGVARIFASFNDTFVHVTDLRFVFPL